MKNKLISILLIVFMSISSLPISVFADGEETNIDDFQNTEEVFEDEKQANDNEVIYEEEITLIEEEEKSDSLSDEETYEIQEEMAEEDITEIQETSEEETIVQEESDVFVSEAEEEEIDTNLEEETVEEEVIQEEEIIEEDEEVLEEEIEDLQEEEVIQEEEIIEEETTEETEEIEEVQEVDPTKQFAYRLIVGFNGEANTREEDVVLGSFNNVVLIGFDSAEQLNEAKNYYAQNAAFASIDGVLSASDGGSSNVNVDTAQSSANDTASMEDNPLNEASETSSAPIQASSVIALIDTGASGSNVYKQLSVIGESGSDDNGHGTLLASIIGEINPNAKVLSIKALNGSGTGTVASVYVAIKLAIDSNVNYIVCPFSSLGYSEAIRSIIQEATNKGIKVVVSAGNDGNSAINYCPANIEEAITVGALDINGEIANFSNRGSMIDAWVFANSTSEAAVIVAANLSKGEAISDYEVSFDYDYDDALPNPVDGDNIEFSTTYKTTTDSLVDGGVYIIRLRKDPNKSIVQQTGSYSNGNKFVLSNADKREDSNGQFKLQKINYNFYLKLRDNTAYIMSPEGGANNLGTNGQKVHMWQKSSSNYQDFDQWWMKANGSYYRITNGKNTGMHLQTEGASTAGNTYLHLWNATSGTQGDWIFERVWYNVKFNPNGGSGSAYTQKFWQEEKKALTANTFTKAGYTFNGWNTNSAGTGTNYSNGQNVQTLTSTNAATFNLYAKWKVNTYTVAYNGNGATSGSMSNSSFNYDSTYTLTANAYSRTGYTFNGWNTKSDGTGTNYNNQQSIKNLTTTSGATITLYAQWTPITYTVKYNGNGSTSGATSNSSHTYDVDKKLTTNGFERLGYIFDGWNTNTSGTGTSYSNNQSVKNLTSTNSGTVNLYAIWKPITYSITYNGNGATSGSTLDSTHTYDQEGQLTKNTYERVGYTFAGWNTDSDGSGTSYSDQAKVLNLSHANNGDVVLFAQWTPNTYTVKYNGNGATSGETLDSTHIWNVTHNLTTNGFQRVGYTFDGWNSNEVGTGTTYEDKDPVKNLTSEANGIYNLYAKWAPNKCEITFDSQSATSQGTSKIYYLFDTPTYYSDGNHETVITKIDNPVRTGYIFSGYYSELHGEGIQYIDENGNFVNDPYKLVNTTLYAKWTAKNYTIALDANGGTLVPNTENPQTAIFDEHTVIHHPIYEGYTFNGWNISNMEAGVTHEFGDVKNTDDTAVNIDTTSFKNLRASEGQVDFVAQWKANKYNVLFDADEGELADGTANPMTVNYDETYTVASPSKKGHVFHGWKITGMYGSKHYINDIETSESTYILETSDNETSFKNLNSHNKGEVHFTALWAEKEYTVLFDLNGGTLDGISDGEEKVYGYDHTFTILNPERPGYTFDGWRISGMNEGSSHLVGGEEITADQVGGVKGVSFGRLNMNAGTVTFEATWESDDITVILSAPEANADSEYTRRIYYTYDVHEYFADPEHTTALSEPIEVPERDNYIFTGYYDSSDGSGDAIIYADGSIHADLSKIYPAPHNLYAGWDPVVYQIDLEQEEATTKGSEVIYEKYNTGIYFDETATNQVNTIEIPVKEVTVSFDGNGVNDPASMKVALDFVGYFDNENPLIGPAGQLLPAFVGTYFDKNSSLEVKWSTGTMKLPTPEDRPAYSFDGWYTEANEKVGNGNDTYIVSKDTKLIAKWVEDPKLTYDKNASDASGEVIDSSAKLGKLVNIAENNYERKGYTFIAWNSKQDGSGNTYKENTSVVWNEELGTSDSYTLYAMWEENTFASIKEIDDHPFTGEEIKVDVTVIDNKGNIVDPSEYELSFENNIIVGTATVIATAKADGNYKTSEVVSTTFNITKAPYSQFKENKENNKAVYDGDNHAVKVSATSEDDNHKYKIAYASNEEEAIENAQAQTTSSKTNDGYNVKYVKDSGTIYYHIIPDNYEAYTGTLTASITPKELTISGITAEDKTYDGTTDVTLGGSAKLEGLVSGDDVNLNAENVIANSASKNAGEQKVIISDYELEGNDKDNYVLSQPEDVTIIINKKPVSFTWSDLTYSYDGTNKVYEGATVNSDDVIDGDNVTVAAYAENVKVDAGNYTAKVTALSGSDSNNYSIGENNSHDWSIGKTSNVVIVSMDDWTYGKKASEPVVDATYGKENATYQYSIDGETWSNDKPSNAGNYHIRATIPAGNNYYEANAINTFTIEKANIKVIANDVSSVRNEELLTDIGFEVTGDFIAEDKASLETLITVSTNANKASAGVYETVANYTDSQAISTNYNVTFVNGTYTVTRNNSSVTAIGYNGTYDGQKHTATITVNNDEHAKVYYSYGDDSNVINALNDVNNNYADDSTFGTYYSALAKTLNDSEAWDEEAPTYTNVGTNTVKYIVITDQSKPDVIQGYKEVVINKAPLTITANNNAITYGEEASGNGVTYNGFVNNETEEKIQGELLYDIEYKKFGNVGTYLITPKGLQADNYELTFIGGTLTVNPLAVELTWSPSETEFTYNGNTYKVSAAVNNKLNGDDVNVATYENNINSEIGKYVASATSLSGNKSNNYTLTNGTNLTYNWSIANKTNNVTVTIEDWTYGESANAPVVKADFNQNNKTVKYYDEQQHELNEIPSKAGKYYVKAFVPSDGYYLDGESEFVEFNINKKNINILIDDKISKHGKALLDLTYQLNDKLVSADDLGEIVLSTTASKEAASGEYPITATYTSNDNYNVTVNNGTYTISKAALSANASGYTGEYDGKAHGIEITLDPRANDKVTIYYSTGELTQDNYSEATTDAKDASVTRKDVGTTKVYYYITSEYYESEPVTGSQDIIITKKALTVKANNNEAQYGQDIIDAGVTYEGLIEGDEANIGEIKLEYVNYEKGSGVGEYVITPYGLDNDNYYINYVDATLTINPLPVTLSWDKNSFDYNGEVQSPIATITNKFADDDVVVGEYNGNQQTNVGSYVAEALSLSGEKANNYKITNSEVSTTHNWKIVQVNNVWVDEPTIDDWTYSKTASEPSATPKFGGPVIYEYKKLGEEDRFYSNEKPTQVGTYIMRATVIRDDNYRQLSKTVEFNILPAEVTVIIADKTSPYRSEISPLTYTLSDEDIDASELGIVLSTNATLLSSVGQYPITGTWNNNPNYNVTIQDATYNIVKAYLRISASDVIATYDGLEHGINVEITEPSLNDAIIWYSDEEITPENFDTVKKTDDPTAEFVTLEHVGNKTIYYYVQSENFDTNPEDQDSSIYGSNTVTVKKHDLTISVNEQHIIYGDLANAGKPHDNKEGISYTIPTGCVDDINFGEIHYDYDYEQFDNVGTYDITVSSDSVSSENYNITFEKGTLVVEPRPITFNWVDENGEEVFAYEYDGNNHSVIAIPQTLNNDIFEGELTYENNSASVAGTYKAFVTHLPNEEKANNYVIKEDEHTASQPWVINIANNAWLTHPSIEEWTYGKQASTPVVKAKFGDSSKRFYYYDEANDEWSNNVPSQAGNYKMKVVVDGTENYTGLEADVEFTIHKAKITVSADNLSSTYLDSLHDFSYSVQGRDGDEFIEGDQLDVEFESKVKQTSHVGQYTITAEVTNTDALNNYDIEHIDGLYTITRRNIGLDAYDYEGTYDGLEHGIEVVVKQIENAEQAEVFYSLEDFETLVDLDALRSDVTGSVYHKISKELTSVLSDKVSQESPKISQVTDSPITVYYLLMSENYHVLTGSKQVIINKAPLTITAIDKETTFGDIVDDDGVTYEGFVDSEDKDNLEGELVIDIDYKQFDDINDDGFKMSPRGLTSNNYDIKYVDGTLTVKPLDINDPEVEFTITPASAEFEYDGTEKTPVVTLTLHAKDHEGNEIDYRLKEVGDYLIKGERSSSRPGVHPLTIAGVDNFTGSIDEQWFIKGDSQKEEYDVENGKVILETDVNANGIEIEVPNLSKELALSALNKEEIERVEAGETAYVFLEVNVIDELPQKDETSTQEKLDEIPAEACLYLDITVWKKIGDDPIHQVAELTNEASFVIEVPEEYHNTDENIERYFYVLRTHEGLTQVLAGPTTDTIITFKSGLFSSYTIAFRDKILDNKDDTPEKKDDIPEKPDDYKPERRPYVPQTGVKNQFSKVN